MYFGLSTRITKSGGDAPALALDLLRDTADSRLTFSRASGATDIINGVLTQFASDTPRQSIANGLLIEGARTNLAKPSTSVALQGTLTGGQADPLGGTQAFLHTETATTSTQLHSSGAGTISFVAGTLYSISAFYKAGSCDRVQLSLSVGTVATGDCYANFYLSGAGSVSASGATASGAFITALGDGWYRCGFMFTCTTTAPQTLYHSSLITGSEAKAPGILGSSRTFTQYGAQCEDAYGITSFIPTWASTATRAADLCSVDVSGLTVAAEGTLWVDAKPNDSDPAAVTSPRVANLNNGGTSYHEVKRNAADTLAQAGTSTGGVTQSGLAGTAWTSGSTARAAYSWKANDMAFCFAGGTVATDTSSPDGMPASITTLRLGANSATSGFFYGWVRGVRLWNHRLGNEQLKAMTQ